MMLDAAQALAANVVYVAHYLLFRPRRQIAPIETRWAYGLVDVELGLMVKVLNSYYHKPICALDFKLLQ